MIINISKLFMTSELQKIKSKIEKLDKNESIEIFKIMVKNEINYSQNNNGIFIDLNFLNENSLIEIKAFLDFIEENKKHINEIETKIKQNKINLDNKSYDSRKNQSNKYEIIICNDYSPFITDLEDNYIIDEPLSIEKINECEDVPNETNIDEDLNDVIDGDGDGDGDGDIDELDEDDGLSLSINNKKKKIQGLQYRILKKCKNINNINGDIDDLEKEYYFEQELKELLIEKEYS
jgi:hypothetical protein